MQTRSERDSLGERKIPAEAYYGIQTDRAIENFAISGLKPKPSYIAATVHIKKSAAKVNMALGLLEARKADAIIRACDQILRGELQEWFVVDVYQAGAGTSHNMNANEVIANRAIELLGGAKGDYSVLHPNDDVNMGQSTNDVCPTAIRISAVELTRLLIPFRRRKGPFQKKPRSSMESLNRDALIFRMPSL
jgi:aspartate ammonia-lyase